MSEWKETVKHEQTETTKLSLSVWHGTYTVEVPKTDMSIPDFMEDVIEPLLLASGYSQAAIDKYFRNSNGEINE